MPIQPERRDHLPNTPTAAALGRAMLDTVQARRPGDPRPGEIEIDPDAPNAPVCRKPKYITVDPDDPNAPVCKRPKYIVAPEPESLQHGALPAWARGFGDNLSDRFSREA